MGVGRQRQVTHLWILCFFGLRLAVEEARPRAPLGKARPRLWCGLDPRVLKPNIIAEVEPHVRSLSDFPATAVGKIGLWMVFGGGVQGARAREVDQSGGLRGEDVVIGGEGHPITDSGGLAKFSARQHRDPRRVQQPFGKVDPGEAGGRHVQQRLHRAIGGGHFARFWRAGRERANDLGRGDLSTHIVVAGSVPPKKLRLPPFQIVRQVR